MRGADSVPSNKATVHITTHDSERWLTSLTQRDGSSTAGAYALAHVFMLFVSSRPLSYPLLTRWHYLGLIRMDTRQPCSAASPSRTTTRARRTAVRPFLSPLHPPYFNSSGFRFRVRDVRRRGRDERFCVSTSLGGHRARRPLLQRARGHRRRPEQLAVLRHAARRVRAR